MEGAEYELITTADGSHTLRIAGTSITFHSIYGAVGEAKIVFINPGLKDPHISTLESVRIFDCGFGSGLNALLTLLHCVQTRQTVLYETVEPFPINLTLIESLNYCEQIAAPELKEAFHSMHACGYGQRHKITDYFWIVKRKASVLSLRPDKHYDLVYFDPFAPTVQPEIWSEAVFKNLYSCMAEKGILLTYSSKGEVRRTLSHAGFQVSKLAGPPGKKEITLARKLQ
jgi:tRNA U34 5-methylaminomethyl-2-thiouridine-forming methyltransferase MnmC